MSAENKGDWKKKAIDGLYLAQVNWVLEALVKMENEIHSDTPVEENIERIIQETKDRLNSADSQINSLEVTASSSN